MLDAVSQFPFIPMIIVFLTLFMLFKAIRIVPQGYEWTVVPHGVKLGQSLNAVDIICTRYNWTLLRESNE